MSPRHLALNDAASKLYDELRGLVARVEFGDWSKEKRGYVKLTESEELAVIGRCEAILREVADLENTVVVNENEQSA